MLVSEGDVVACDYCEISGFSLSSALDSNGLVV